MKKLFGNFKTDYWHRLDDGRVVCDLCPRHCTLREGKQGVCFIRQASDGEIVLTSYGRASGFAVDPIEKKPLNHFYPGTLVYSFGTVGCNLGCKFCQNWRISKIRDLGISYVHASPEEIAQSAASHLCKSVAFTYNDPVTFMEYARDTAIESHRLGLKTVAVSAGYICQKPRKEFFAYIDAANIDLKAISDRFYRKLCGAELAPVLDTLLYLKKETQVWLEITTLLIPGYNDNPEEIRKLSKWIVDNLGSEVPLHLSAFHPDFKMRETPQTPLNTLLLGRDIAQDSGLEYVYTGNIRHQDTESTYCPNCQRVIIRRNGFQVNEYHLTEKGECQFCAHRIRGCFD